MGRSVGTGCISSLDDDFVYPPDYVARVVAGLARYRGAAIVGFHGVRLKTPLRSYRRDRQVLHWDQPLQADTAVHVLGTGLMAFDAGQFPVSREDFGSRNMADLWFARLSQLRRIPMICLAHEQGWLKSLPVENSLYRQMCRDDSRQIALARSMEWRLWEVPEQVDGLLACDDRFVLAGSPPLYRCGNPAVLSCDRLVDGLVCRECGVRRDSSAMR